MAASETTSTRTVRVRFQLASQAVVHTDVQNTYQKGGMFCVRLSSKKVVKYPMAHIFDVTEVEEG